MNNQNTNQLENIALALYNINKIAKQERDKASDIRNNIYNDDNVEIREDRNGEEYEYHNATSAQHRAMNNWQEKSETSYNIKDKFLKLTIQKYNIQPLGYHEFADKNRDYYEFGGHGFHSNNFSVTKNLGTIENLISSEKIGKKLSWQSAIDILHTEFEEELKIEKEAEEKVFKENLKKHEIEEEKQNQIKAENRKVFEKILNKYKKLNIFSNIDDFWGNVSFSSLGGKTFTFVTNTQEKFEIEKIKLYEYLESRKQSIEKYKKEAKRLEIMKEKMLQKIKTQKKMSYMSRVINIIGMEYEDRFVELENILKMPKETVIDCLNKTYKGYGRADNFRKNIKEAEEI